MEGRKLKKSLSVSKFWCPTPADSKHMHDPYVCHGQKSFFWGDGHTTFNRNPYNGYINPYYWVDDHPLLYGNNESLDPGTCKESNRILGTLNEG